MPRPLFLLLLLAVAPGLRAQQEVEAAAQERTAAVLLRRGPQEELAALRPVLIGKRYLDQARQRLAVQLARLGRGEEDAGAWFENQTLVARAFLPEVEIIYVLDFAEGARLVSRGMMKSWGMDEARLHQRALANLERWHGEIVPKQVGRLPWLYVIETTDGYAASRVLLHWRWAELMLSLGEALVLGMPTRDVVVFTANLEAEKLAQLRETVETVERHQGRPVSRKLYQWTPQGWQELEDPPAARERDDMPR